MTIDLAAADALLSTTRAVRKRLDFTRPVPREVILDLHPPVAAGADRLQQPDLALACDRRCRKAEARSPRSTRAAAGSMLSDARKAAHDQGEAQTERVYGSAEYLADHLHEVPVHVIPCFLGKPYPGHEGASYASIYPAVWSFQLALRPRGLGTVLTTLTMMKQTEIAALLGIPDNVTQCALLPVAYTIGHRLQTGPAPER